MNLGISNWLKKRTIKKLVYQLPSDLARRYGKSDYYTRRQIEVTLEELDYPKRYRGYAFIINMELEAAAEALASSETAEKMATEISEWFFNGQRDFRSRTFVRTPTTEAPHNAD